jgi:hypothetical protein
MVDPLPANKTRKMSRPCRAIHPSKSKSKSGGVARTDGPNHSRMLLPRQPARSHSSIHLYQHLARRKEKSARGRGRSIGVRGGTTRRDGRSHLLVVSTLRSVRSTRSPLQRGYLNAGRGDHQNNQRHHRTPFAPGQPAGAGAATP